MNGRLKNWLEGDGLHFLIELGLVAALAVMLAHWTWVFATPATLAAPSRISDENAGTDVPRGLFGAASARAESTARGYRLVGVISPGNGLGGRAVFKVEGGAPRQAGLGEAIAPGVRLKEVHPDHVVLERDGTLERLKLDRRAAAVPERPAAR